MSNPESRPVIEVQALCKQVKSPEGQLELLQDIEFNILPGEAVAILGASGSGKTTLLGLLAGLDTPSSGRVMLNGIDIFALDEDGRADLRRDMTGFVFQSFQLLANLTAVENVMLPLELFGRRDAREAAESVLERVGLGRRLHHYPRHLSGGEQQRVAIGRAFVTGPRLLFADEPTGNLDQVTGERVIELLFEMNRERKTTLILVTHDESIARRCSRRLTLENGRLTGIA